MTVVSAQDGVTEVVYEISMVCWHYDTDGLVCI
jgi:hypothetical protein